MTGAEPELAIAYQKVGDILGSPLAANLGDTPGAAEVQKAIDIEEALVRRTLAKATRRTAKPSPDEPVVTAPRTAGASSMPPAGFGIMERLAALHPGDAAIEALPRHRRHRRSALRHGRPRGRSAPIPKGRAVIEAVLRDAPQDEEALRSLMANYDGIVTP
jgi:hypothetical protein